MLSLPSASSQALPAPKPSPTQAGHALRLKRRTENTTPKERPRDERMRKEEMAWSHCCFVAVSHDIAGRMRLTEYHIAASCTHIENTTLKKYVGLSSDKDDECIVPFRLAMPR